MYFIFSIIKINHPFIRNLSSMGVLMIYNTDSGLLLPTIIIYAFTKLRKNIFKKSKLFASTYRGVEWGN